MTLAAFQGSYADMRFIKTRSVCAITIEIPIEQAAAFVAAFGAPNPAVECPVAIARINPAKATEKPASDAPMQSVAQLKTPRRFSELPYATQAALKCDDPAFHLFLREKIVDDGRSPAEIVREICGVRSRAEIQPGTDAEGRWRWILSGYEAWMAHPQ